MTYDPKLTPEEQYLTDHINGLHGSASPANVTGGDVYDTRAFARNVEAEAAWGERTTQEMYDLIDRQGKEYLRRFSVADDAPEAPKQ